MDGYVSKPIRREEIRNAMRESFSCKRKIVPEPDIFPEEKDGVFSMERAMQSTGGDIELFGEIVGLFLENYPRNMSDILGAIQKRDASLLSRSAHSLKGAVANFGADRAFEAALRLEKMGDAADLEKCTGAYTALQGEIEKLGKALLNQLKGSPSGEVNRKTTENRQ
jgi:HPt (histidine-containing phosphotransfer) domain-containing protein